MVADGSVSVTARRVAAYRLAFERLGAPYGDPASDDRLAGDVAGGEPRPVEGQGMWRHLLGRTLFFDRVVVDALDRNVTQIVSVGAGYDGRALRYHKPGARWWEVDHPDTQADKRRRLDRLQILADHIAFVPVDLREDSVSTALVSAEFAPGSPALFLCEGVAVYLEMAVLEMLLGNLRSVSIEETRLAISVGSSFASPERTWRRQRFADAVAAVGEPALNQLTAADAGELLDETGWRFAEASERAQQAGFVVLMPA